MTINFIGGGNRSTHRKPHTCLKSLTNFITYCCIGYTSSWGGFTTLMVIGTDCIGSCKPYYNAIATTTAPQLFSLNVKCTILHDNKMSFLFKLNTNEKLNELLSCKHTWHHLHSRSLQSDDQLYLTSNHWTQKRTWFMS